MIVFDERFLSVSVVVLAITVLILLISILIIATKLSKIKKRYNLLIGDTEDGINIEQVLIKLQAILGKTIDQQNTHQHQLDHIKQTLAQLKSNIGILRYNAFNETGNDLSFSLAIINREQDGVVISGIHGREQTYLYAKPLLKGQSKYAITTEEEQAIYLALNSEMS